MCFSDKKSQMPEEPAAPPVRMATGRRTQAATERLRASNYGRNSRDSGPRSSWERDHKADATGHLGGSGPAGTSGHGGDGGGLYGGVNGGVYSGVYGGAGGGVNGGVYGGVYGSSTGGGYMGGSHNGGGVWD